MEDIQKKTIDSIDITDSDGDGLYDVFEINGMKLSNGQVVKTDSNNIDTDGDGISDFEEMGGLSSEKQVYIDGNLYSCTIFHNKSRPELVDSDNDQIPDGIDSNPHVVDAIEIATLRDESYFQVDNSDQNYFGGGNQMWWKGNNQLIKRSGCGLIASCDVELYLSVKDSRFDMIDSLSVNTDKIIDYASYKAFVENRESDRYKMTDLIGEGLDQVDPWTIVSGLNEFYSDNDIDYHTSWEKSWNSNVVNNYIIDNINDNIPVVASFYGGNKKLECYEKFNNNVKSKTSFSSHYFIITGVYKAYDLNSNQYEMYYSIVSGGKKYYIYSSDLLNKLSYFTNIIYTSN